MSLRIFITKGNAIQLNVHYEPEKHLISCAYYCPVTQTHHCDEVPKPLMSQLVPHYQRHPLLGFGGGVLRINQQGRLSVCHQTPVLHCT